jgi:multidrug efflux system membrane fusion protein
MNRELNRKLTIGFSLVIAATCGCSKQAAPSETPAVPVRVAEVKQLQVGNVLQYSANIVPNDQVSLMFQSGGYVGSILRVRGADGRVRFVDVGDFVKAGTVIASVRPSQYQDRIQEAEADLARAQATEVAAKLSFGRMSTLYATASATKPEYDDSEAQFARSAASVKEARAQLENAHTQLTDSILRVQEDGWITARNISVGSLVNGSATAFSMIDTHLVKASFGIPDTQMQLVRLGQTLQVNIDAVGDFTGRVTSVSPSADSKTKVYTVEVTLPNPEARLKSGMIATLALREARPHEVTVVPLGAVLRSPQDPHAFMVMIPESASNGYIARPRTVQLGETYGNNFAVTSGLQPGDRVVTTGAGLVHDGDRLQFIP